MPCKLRVSIPKPCQENWQDMTPVEQGRFCNVCSKNVYDFTKLSDDGIINILSREKISCGKFTVSQLNRDIIKKNNKNSLWSAYTAAIMSFFTIGIQEVNAQATIESHRNNTQPSCINDKKNDSSYKNRRINGIVSDFVGGLPGSRVLNISTGNEEQTDLNGKFSIEADEWDSLKISMIGYKAVFIDVSEVEFYTIKLSDVGIDDDVVIDRYGGIEVKKPTFFGRILNSIGNVFR